MVHQNEVNIKNISLPKTESKQPTVDKQFEKVCGDLKKVCVNALWGIFQDNPEEDAQWIGNLKSKSWERNKWAEGGEFRNLEPAAENLGLVASIANRSRNCTIAQYPSYGISKSYTTTYITDMVLVHNMVH